MTPANTATLRRTVQIALPIGILGTIAFIIGLFVDRSQFFHSYLFAWFFWFGFPFGCLGILQLHFLMGGAWGVVTRRFFEAGAATMPLIAVLFIPLLFGLKDNYIWARPEEVAADSALAHKTPYLNVPFFILRAAVFLGLWIAMEMLVNRKSREQDQTIDPKPTKWLETFSAPALIVLFVTGTFASFDWLMSLEPHWYSSIYGLVVVVGAGVSGMALITMVVAILSEDDPLLNRALTPLRFQNLGTLLFTFIFFWAYLEFSQLLIVWYGNLKIEIPWYLHRIDGAWAFVSGLIFVIHFAVPFVLLLFRGVKREKASLVKVCAVVLIARVIDAYWMIMPDVPKASQSAGVAGRMPWLDVAAFVAIGGIWLAAFAWRLGRHDLLPVRAPGIEEALEPVYGQAAVSAGGGGQ